MLGRCWRGSRKGLTFSQRCTLLSTHSRAIPLYLDAPCPWVSAWHPKGATGGVSAEPSACLSATSHQKRITSRFSQTSIHPAGSTSEVDLLLDFSILENGSIVHFGC
jgi:hypothetical protein